MDFKLVEKRLSFSQKRKKWLILLAVFGVSGYSVYRVYNLPSVVKKRKRLMKLFGALISVAELVSDSSETIGVVAKDLGDFLKSDSDQIPNSLKQLSKIAKSDEFSESLARVTEAMTVGLFRGYKDGTKYDNELEIGKVNLSFSDTVLDKLFSAAGCGFVSVVVGSFAKNLVMAFFSGGNTHPDASVSQSGSNLSDAPRWLNLVCDNRCKTLIADCIQVFVGTATAVYLEKTMDVNTYDQLFSGLTNDQHQSKVKDFLATICNSSVETLVKTSHQVLTSSKSGSNSSSVQIQNQSEGSYTVINNKNLELDASSKQLIGANGWVGQISSTLAVPSNRKFVLDLTGRMTFETTRSVVEFLSWKIMNGLKKSVNVVEEEVVDRGLEVVRYFGAKSSIICRFQPVENCRFTFFEEADKKFGNAERNAGVVILERHTDSLNSNLGGLRCTSFFTIRSSSSHGSSACKKLDGVATWLMNGLAAAFFASLDRCSCIRFATEDYSCERTDLPLILDYGNLQRGGSREDDG